MKRASGSVRETDGIRWRLIWHDEFDGVAGASPNPAKWVCETGGEGWGNLELQYYSDTADNAFLDGAGSLVLAAHHVACQPNNNLMCWYGPCRYTSARLSTRGRFEFTYGRVEARLRLPYGQGIWPAFWLLGANVDLAPWPKCGEIDIMEHIGREPGTIHGSLHGPSCARGREITRSYTLPQDQEFHTDFYRFAVEWLPDRISWSVDDCIYLEVSSAELSSLGCWVFDRPFFLMLNLAVGGSWPGFPDAQSIFPQHLLVDYVRVFAPDLPSAS